jgi:hypothetical protein
VYAVAGKRAMEVKEGIDYYIFRNCPVFCYRMGAIHKGATMSGFTGSCIDL